MVAGCGCPYLRWVGFVRIALWVWKGGLACLRGEGDFHSFASGQFLTKGRMSGKLKRCYSRTVLLSRESIGGAFCLL